MERMPPVSPVDRALMWFRRDLRVADNAALYHALKNARAVFCLFVFDREILDALPNPADRRVEFIWESVAALRADLQARGGDLIIRHAHAVTTVPELAAELKVDAVFTNTDYEPAAIARDTQVAEQLALAGCRLHTFKDQVIFGPEEVLTQAGGTFGVFTPYKNAWLKKLNPFFRKPYPVLAYTEPLAKPRTDSELPALEAMGFTRTNLKALGVIGGAAGAQVLLADFQTRIAHYRTARDYPAVKGVSYLSVHNRFGTVSIRALVNAALAGTSEGHQTWLSELIWRDFYFQILANHPRVVETTFKPEYAALPWPNDRERFAAWCGARTGYPIVDAAMRQINQTGYMHNRLRMVVASFLTKDLLIDWRWGERYFAEHLIDFDLAANNGGWQWAASTGCDAQPYFRIFNPVSQSERFDGEGRFIRRYLPELQRIPDRYLHAPWTLPPVEAKARDFELGRDYPKPIVEHAVERERALDLFKKAKAA
jgi:deoxyribodipyrimidine photo-lyase